MCCPPSRCFAVRDERDSLKLNYVLYLYSSDVIHTARAPVKVCRLVAFGGFLCGRVNDGVGSWRESICNPATTIGSRLQTSSLTGRDLVSKLDKSKTSSVTCNDLALSK